MNNPTRSSETLKGRLREAGLLKCPKCDGPTVPSNADGQPVEFCPKCWAIIDGTPAIGVIKAPAEKNPTCIEDELAHQLAIVNAPTPAREFRALPERRYRSDFAWPAIGLLVEVEGGLYGYGRHNQPQGYINDTRKYNALVLAGWTVLRYTSKDVFPEPGQVIGPAATEILTEITKRTS